MANQNQPLLTLSTILSDPTLLVPGTSILISSRASALLPPTKKAPSNTPSHSRSPAPLPLNVTLPATITNEYKLLGRAVWAAESWGNYTIGEDGKAVRSFKPVSKSKASSAESEGKIKAMEEAKEEMQKAIKYIQVATAGFGGFWKMAGLGASSFIAVQGGEGETLMRIQLLTVDLSLLSANVRAKALKDFAEKGRKWAPEKRWITGWRLDDAGQGFEGGV
ncbi:hypothetical protein G7Y89_g12984 [Cudoniella acicularis]|uniref:Uncharacterized protein n=1 Tax=Cudoniella acicularis TaxID=354080 RepID=A0A8H4VYN7_9HELO|nr:hypothetical protein G7Y89_g12984 [Cudoniella acicularis]